jgi:NAD+ kinase
MKRIGILYHPKRDKAIAFSQELEIFLNKMNISTWRCSAWEPENARPQIGDSNLVLSIGGDGTILRSARVIIPDAVPILGINLGRLGFMTELEADEAINKLPAFLNGNGWIEQRAILEARISSENTVFHALNDAFIGRRSVARLVNIKCKINGEHLTTYRADGVIVSTASGSTGYSLAINGPVLQPQAKEIILKPISPHFTFDKALVLPPDTIISLKINTNHESMISIDGQLETPLQSEEEISIKLSTHMANFLRMQPVNYFYQQLESKLNRKIS